MHIAIACRGLGHPGAVASIALRQARELTRHARVTLVSDGFPADLDWANRILVRVPDLGMLRRFRHVPDEIAFARASRRALRSLQSVDFILTHAHSTAYLAARGLGIPFGFFVHGDIFARPKGTYDARLTAFYRWIAPRAYASADVVFALAPYLGEMARARGARKVEVVPNGVDVEDLGVLECGSRSYRRRMPPAALEYTKAAAAAAALQDKLRILTVSRLSTEKGLDHLLDACRLLTIDYELTIAGTGPLEHELRTKAADLNQVRFLGAVPRTSLGALYQAHDLFVTPTLNEAFALVVLEALACGLPVIGTDIDALRAVVRDGENGLLVPPADPNALASAITKLADEELRMKLAKNAHASVLPRYSWTAIGDEIANIIRRMRS